MRALCSALLAFAATLALTGEARALDACGGGYGVRYGASYGVCFGIEYGSPSDVVVLANAGADDSDVIGASQTLDCSGSTGETACAWTVTTNPTGGDYVIADAAACTTTGYGRVAGAYVLTCTINTGASADTMTSTVTGEPHPLWSSFDRAELKYFLNNFAADQNDEGETYYAGYLTYGTDAEPTPPTRPTMTNETPVTCADTATCLTAIKGNPNRIVRPTADLGTISCDETCNDVRVEVTSGITIDGFLLSDASGAASTLEITGDIAGVAGAGCIGTIQHSSDFTASNIYIHGLSISPECMSTPTSYNGLSFTYAVDNFALAHVVMRGFEASGVNGSCVFMGNVNNTDMAFLNFNCKAAETVSGAEDAWGMRYSGTRVVVVGTVIESWHKPNIRLANNAYSGFWTPAALMSGNRHTTFYAPYKANTVTSVSVGGLTSNENIFGFRARMFLSSLDAGSSDFYWGPSAVIAEIDTAWAWGGIDFTTSSDTLMSATLLSNREASENAGDGPWSLNALAASLVTRNAADANTHTVGDPIAAMAWTAVVDPQVGTIAGNGNPDNLLDGIP